VRLPARMGALIARKSAESPRHASPGDRRTAALDVSTHVLTSANNGHGTHPLRVLAPTQPAAGAPHSFLYVLPVEAERGSVYGDGMETLGELDAHNRYNLTIVEPSFGIEPWYADNPNDHGLRHETFMVDDLVPWVSQNLARSGDEQNWLLGFSKSGLGAIDLILKHPDVFDLAAAWDFPANMATANQFGASSADAYGTEANFQDYYRLTRAFVEARRQPFLVADRLWLGGYSVFRSDMSDFETLLTSAGILHTTGSPEEMPHRWDGGWVASAVHALHGKRIGLSVVT